MEETGAKISDVDILKAKTILDAYKLEMGKVIAGQEEMIEGLLTVILAGGHCLLEGAPGLAKTLAVRTLAAITGMDFKRIQFTPDLLPADLTGTLVWEQNTNSFSVRKGPVFSNIILADEINRAPAKVQSALLEAMEEGQVTIGEDSIKLPEDFFVLATQNPIEHEGTYPLPEAQLDRFLLKLIVRYPSTEDELRILKLNSVISDQKKEKTKPLARILDGKVISSLRKLIDSIHLDESIARYMISVVEATRPAGAAGSAGGAALKAESAAIRAGKEGIYRYISYGASPRAVIALHHCSKISALLAGNSFVKPEDVKKAALPVLRHRIVLSYEAEADGLEADNIINRILSFIPVP